VGFPSATISRRRHDHPRSASACRWASPLCFPSPPQQPRPTPLRRAIPTLPAMSRATSLPDATLPPANKDGNFILGPTHPPAPEMTANPSVPQGTVTEITMTSADSKFYPGIARDPGTFGTPDPGPSRAPHPHHLASSSLDAHRHRLRPASIRPRRRRPLHRWSRRPRPCPLHRPR